VNSGRPSYLSLPKSTRIVDKTIKGIERFLDWLETQNNQGKRQ